MSTVEQGRVTGRLEPVGRVVLAGRGLTKRYGDTVALGGVDLSLRAGEVVAVMGPSGSGKTTLLHVLAAISPPDHGEVWLEGSRIDGLSETKRTALRRRRFGFVFQSGQLLAELPAVENIALPLLLEGVARRRAVERARAWLPELGLDGLGDRRPGELSGGQAQRVAIARALVGQPAVVFADEPTAALDRATGAETVDRLADAARRSGAAVLIVTHDPSVLRVCDRRLEIVDGGFVDGGFVDAEVSPRRSTVASALAASVASSPEVGG